MCCSINLENHIFTNIFIFRTCHIYLDTGSNIYLEVIMNAMASQITGVSTVGSDTDQRKHQSSASLVTGEFPAQKASNAENVSI